MHVPEAFCIGSPWGLNAETANLPKLVPYYATTARILQTYRKLRTFARDVEHAYPIPKWQLRELVQFQMPNERTLVPQHEEGLALPDISRELERLRRLYTFMVPIFMSTTDYASMPRRARRGRRE